MKIFKFSKIEMEKFNYKLQIILLKKEEIN